MKSHPRLSPHFVVAMVVLLIGAAGLSAALRFTGTHLQKLPIEPQSGLRFHTLPTETQSWEQYGIDPPPLSAEVIEELGTENYISRRYVEKNPADGRQPNVFDLHCAYYTGMIDTVPHVPERCFVGGGMTIDGAAGAVTRIPLDLSRFTPDPTVDPALGLGTILRGRTDEFSTQPGPGVRVRMPSNLEDLSLNVTRFSDQTGASLLAGYFFIANGAVAPRAEHVRLLAFRNSDVYAYYAKVQFTSPTVDTPEELAEIAASFLNEMLPDIMVRTPDWVEVIERQSPRDAESSVAVSTDESER